MIQLTPHMRIMVAASPVDFRKGIDGLAAVCKQELKSEPFCGTVFVFVNKARTALRLLIYDGQRQLDEAIVEPNSGLGKAIKYMLRHWEKLTRFLHVAGAPLDNNICERALKHAILHRKNALFYKTQHGAKVGDLFISLIHTCQLEGINPLKYIDWLLKNAADLEKSTGSLPALALQAGIENPHFGAGHSLPCTGFLNARGCCGITTLITICNAPSAACDILLTGGPCCQHGYAIFLRCACPPEGHAFG